MPRYSIELDDEAKAEAKHGYAYYAERNPAVAERFYEEFLEAIEHLENEAHTYPAYDGETRWYLFPSFPYALLFELINDVVFVTVVMHLKREPGYWKR